MIDLATPPLVLAEIRHFIPIIAIGGGCIVGAITVTMSILHSMQRTKQREITRREVVAYVAEGSMTAEEGERLLNTGDDSAQHAHKK